MSGHHVRWWAVVGIGLLLVMPSTAHAAGALQWSRQPSTACKASSGAGATYFYFANEYVENVTVQGQYIACGVPTVRGYVTGATYPTDGSTSIHGALGLWNPTAAPVEFACVALVGVDFSRTNYRQVARNVTVPAYGKAEFPIAPGELPIFVSFGTFVFNCLVPAGGRLTYMRVVQPRNF